MEDTGSNGSERVGNTKRPSPSKHWCFTLNNYKEKHIQSLNSTFGSIKDCKYIVGREVGEEGTPHLQGYVYFPTKKRPLSLGLSKRIHWEKCKGSQIENIKYCSKEGATFGNLLPIRPLKVLKEEQLYLWQKKVVSIIQKEPDDRKIYWFWEPDGNTGKTTFSKYLSHVYGAIPIEGKKNDILFCAAQYEANIYIFDLERSMEEYVSYAAMEKIKNGYFMCSKYESRPINRNPPHVIVFANFAPDESKLSSDRWKIIAMKKKK